jgi:hypothetical protein
MVTDSRVSAELKQERKRKGGTEVSEINTNVYATQPTRLTLFMRTFVPWQIWRFFAINLRMMLLIGREKHQHR